MSLHARVLAAVSPTLLRRGSRPRPRMRRTFPSLVLALLAAGAGHPATAAPDTPEHAPCEAGVFCAWSEYEYAGKTHSADLRTTNMEECVPLDGELRARSFVNRMNRPVTVYQDARCSTTGDFSTYPEGSFVPRAPFLVRAIKVWSH